MSEAIGRQLRAIGSNCRWGLRWTWRFYAVALALTVAWWFL